jgi:hypothetical protein
MQSPRRAEMIELIAGFLAAAKTPVSIFDLGRIVERRFGKDGGRRMRWALDYMVKHGMVATELITLTRYKLTEKPEDPR